MSSSSSGDVPRRVLQDFAGLHEELAERAGVNVLLYEHQDAHGTPDAVFPNNWFTTHPAGEGNGGLAQSTLVLYPMRWPNRAAERREDILQAIRSSTRQPLQRELSLAGYEEQGRYLEGTGAFVLDRVHGVAYLCVSERADIGLAQEWVQALGYRELVTFHATDARGMPVYHTNVVMAVGSGVAIVCLESVQDGRERQHLLDRLKKHHEVVDITREQMEKHFCGNGLEVLNADGLPIMAMSSRAYHAFTPDQRAVMLKHTAAIHHAPINTLEDIGGGSVRCTIAELF